MSVVIVPRKRTSSFSFSSCPKPPKAPRIMKSSLRRTESYIDLVSQREIRRRATLNRPTVRQIPKPVPPPQRQSSPLSPARTPLPSRPCFPRSRPEPDLYRKALKTSMKRSPEGQKILRMGPHLAVTMMRATMDLERLVACAAGDDEGEEDDVVMQDETTTEDWEMV